VKITNVKNNGKTILFLFVSTAITKYHLIIVFELSLRLAVTPGDTGCELCNQRTAMPEILH